MKSILYVVTMCFCLVHFTQANESFDLDDVTIELVEEGEEIVHQIQIPFTEKDQGEPGMKGQEAGQQVETAARPDKPSERQSVRSFEPVMVDDSKADDEFLDLIEDADELEQLLESEQQEAMALADEMLQQAAEEVQELEQEVEVSAQELEEERRDEEALIDEIRHYEDKEDEEDPGEEPEEIDKERDEEEGIEGVTRQGVSSEGSFD